MTITVRQARPEEFEAIGAIAVAAYERDGQLVGSGYAEHLADVAGRAEFGEILVAIDDTGELLGSVTFTLPGTPLAELSGPGEAEFRMLSVAPSAWGRGVGSLLAQACIARARELDVSAIMICTRSFATVAQTIYEKLGFVRVPERDWVPAPGVSLIALRLELA